MEFNVKLQELRKAKGLTQEELAEALYVSRAAVSKWESGRGYPSIDSLKEVSRFFSITMDDLICAEEIIIAANDERQDTLRKFAGYICSLLDVFIAILLFVPVFGNGSDASVPLFGLSGIRQWIKNLFFVLVMITVLNGICGVILSGLDKPVWSRHRTAAGIALTTAASAVFILTRQPYAGIICFSILIAKGILISKMQ